MLKMDSLILYYFLLTYTFWRFLLIVIIPNRASITAQKIVDERHGPHNTDLWWQSDRRARPFNHFYCAGSVFKGKEEACVSSFKAARYYTDEAAKRRDQLIYEAEANN